MVPPFDAENTAGHNVRKVCAKLEDSRAADCQRRNGIPSARAITDAELTDKITAVHAESK